MKARWGLPIQVGPDCEFTSILPGSGIPKWHDNPAGLSNILGQSWPCFCLVSRSNE